jgi:hypothetical protein
MRGDLMKLYILEMPVERCVDCRNIISCLSTNDDTWRCREIRDKTPDGDHEFRVISNKNLNGDFPGWCPLQNITHDQWIERITKGRKDKAVKQGGPV